MSQVRPVIVRGNQLKLLFLPGDELLVRYLSSDRDLKLASGDNYHIFLDNARWPKTTVDNKYLKHTTNGILEWAAATNDHGELDGLGDDDHSQYHNDTRGDARYFTEAEHINTSAGVPDAGKPIVLDAGGQIDATMINDADVDHGNLTGLGDDDHSQYHNDTRGDARYFTEAEHINTSAGAGDAGKPIILNADGQVDATMISAVGDHGNLTGLGDDDHSQYHNDTRGDARYFTEAEHINTSAGAEDASKPIVLDAGGQIDATMINDADVDHGNLTGLGDDDHSQYHNDTRGDARYFTEAEHINTSAGAEDAGKPIVLDAGGQIDATMINDADVDHGNLTGLGDDDHSQYLLANGTRTLTDNLAVTATKTIDGRDISVDGTKLDGIEVGADVTDTVNVTAAGAAMSGGAFHDGFSDFIAAEHLSHPNTIANTLSDHNLAAHTALDLLAILDTSTTYYISTTGSDETGDGSSENPWATLNGAMTFLAPYYIPLNVTITILYKDGHYGSYTVPDQLALVPSHICSQSISIAGENTYSRTFSSIQSTSGSAGAWYYTLNINSVANIITDDYVLIKSPTGGTWPNQLYGFHRVTNVDDVNTRITVLIKSKYGTASSGAVSGNITVIKSILHFTGSSASINIGKQNNFTFNKLGFVGGTDITSWTNLGCQATGSSIVTFGTSTGFDRFHTAFYQSSASHLGTNCIASGCTYGIRMSAGMIISTAIITGCEYGTMVDNNATLRVASAAASVLIGCNYGYYARTSGFISVGPSYINEFCVTDDFTPNLNTLGSLGELIANT